MWNKAGHGDSTCVGAGSDKEAEDISLKSLLYNHPNGSGQIDESFP